MKKWIIILSSIIGVLVIDLVTKHFLFSVEYFNIIPNVISIASNGGNSGIAFGMFSGNTIMLIIISLVLIVALFIFNYFVKNKNVLYCLSFGFIIGGALGNLVDRVFLSSHAVRDFIFLDFWPTFPTFNFADSFLTVGAILMAIYLIFMAGKNEKT